MHLVARTRCAWSWTGVAAAVAARAAVPRLHPRRHVATSPSTAAADQIANTPLTPPPQGAPDAAVANQAGTSAAPSAYAYSPPNDFIAGMSSLINASRTSTTKILWQMRAQERADMDSHLQIRHASRSPITPIEARSAATDPSEHVPQAAGGTSGLSVPTKVKPSNPYPAILPLDSFWSVSLPFDTDLSLYDDYVRFDGGVRFERILEDLDAFAGNVAHLHVKKGVQRMLADAEATDAKVEVPAMSIVTASVDGITMNPQHRFPMDKHLALQGCVTWVGSSSMEIWIEMRIIRDPAAWSRLTLAEKMSASSLDRQDDVLLNAYFMMVARDQQSGKAAFVPPLDRDRMSESDRARFKRGEVSATRRKAEAVTSLTRTPPTTDEIQLIHQYIMSPDGPNSGLGQNLEIASAPAGLLTPGAVIIRSKTVPMAKTEMQSATMTQPQDRNTNRKVFGGYLMKNAYELARCTAYVYCGANSHPYFIGVDSMSFLRPVEIGSIVSFRAKVSYAAGAGDPIFQIRVETMVHDLVGAQVYPSNVFHFSFQSDLAPVRKVVPNTYREAVDFLDGRRRREKLAEKHREQREKAAANCSRADKAAPAATS